MLACGPSASRHGPFALPSMTRRSTHSGSRTGGANGISPAESKNSSPGSGRRFEDARATRAPLISRGAGGAPLISIAIHGFGQRRSRIRMAEPGVAVHVERAGTRTAPSKHARMGHRDLRLFMSACGISTKSSRFSTRRAFRSPRRLRFRCASSRDRRPYTIPCRCADRTSSTRTSSPRSATPSPRPPCRGRTSIGRTRRARTAGSSSSRSPAPTRVTTTGASSSRSPCARRCAARAGNVYLAQTQASCRQGGIAPPDQGGARHVQMHDGDRAGSRRLARRGRSQRRRHGAVVRQDSQSRTNRNEKGDRRRGRRRWVFLMRNTSITGFMLVALCAHDGDRLRRRAGAARPPRPLLRSRATAGFSTRCSQPGWYRTACPFWEPDNKCPRVDDFDVTYSTAKEERAHAHDREPSGRSASRAQIPADRLGALSPRYRDRLQLLRRGHRPRVPQRGDRRRRAHLVSGPPEGERQDRGRDRERASPSPAGQAHRGRERPHREDRLCAADHRGLPAARSSRRRRR